MLREQGLERRGVSSRSRTTSGGCGAYCERPLKQGMIGRRANSRQRICGLLPSGGDAGHENELSGDGRSMRRLGGGRAGGWGIPILGAEWRAALRGRRILAK